MREPPAAEETEDHAAATSLERELSAGVAAQETVILAAAAQETEHTADADDNDCDRRGSCYHPITPESISTF